MVLSYLTVDIFHCEHFNIQLWDTPHNTCSEAGVYSNLWMVLPYLTVDTFHWVHFTIQLGTYHIMPIHRYAYVQQPVDGAALSNCQHISLGALYYSTGGDTPHNICLAACSNLWMVLSYLTVNTFQWVHFTIQLGTYTTSCWFRSRPIQ